MSIDWVDLVQLHGVTYVAAWTSPGRPAGGQKSDEAVQIDFCPPTRPIRALIRLTLEFRTWELVAHEGMSDRSIAHLLRRAIECVAHPAA